MKRILILGVSFLPILLFIGCGTSNPAVATIGDEKITLHNFEDKYAENSGGWDSCAASSLEDRQKFLDLIVKFKLKIKEARAQGLEKDSAIISELNSYNVSVAQSYITEKEIIEPGVKQLYDRKKEELRASHILFRIPPTATPSDTLAAYKRAMEAIAKILSASFDTLAYQLSEDQSAKTNYGDLGCFAGGRMVPEFEDACYSLKLGDYTKTPVRTRFGYHIIKLTARGPNQGPVRISHILIRFNASSNDTVAVRDTVWMLYHRLKSGASFSEIAQKYSKDPNSAPNGGDVGFFERERIPPVIGDVVYQLQIDSISEPMRFNYGYYIFKVTGKKELPQFAEMQKDLKDTYQQVRYQYELDNYTQELKKQYIAVIDSAAVNRLANSLDTTKTPSYIGWSDTLSSEMLKTLLITTSGRPFTARNFVEKINSGSDYRSYTLTHSNVWTLINKLADVTVLEEYARHAVKRYPSLAQVMREYEDGILLYRIEQDEIWKKIMVNDSLLMEYYNAQKENYRLPERVNFAEIFVLSDSIAKAVYKQVKSGKNFMELAKKYTNRNGYSEKKGEWGFQPFTMNDLSRKASTMAVDSVTAPFQYESGWSIIKALGRDSARVKTFGEATTEISSGYQEAALKQREQEWIEGLKAKYPVSINKEALMEAFKRKRIESQ